MVPFGPNIFEGRGPPPLYVSGGWRRGKQQSSTTRRKRATTFFNYVPHLYSSSGVPHCLLIYNVSSLLSHFHTIFHGNPKSQHLRPHQGNSSSECRLCKYGSVSSKVGSGCQCVVLPYIYHPSFPVANAYQMILRVT